MNTSFSSKFKKYNLPFHGVRVPEFDNYEYSKTKNLTNSNFLKEICQKGFKDKILSDPQKKSKTEEYRKRLQYEFKTIEELGFIDYILIVWDVINYCHENNIAVGLARGSSAGSLLLYLSDITRIDPIEHDLYFERFISKQRTKYQVIDGVRYYDGSLLMDVDTDISYYDRPKVIKYVENKFKGKTCKILTLSTLSAKILIKECGKIVAEKSEEEMNEISSLIPKSHGKVQDITDAYKESDKFRDFADNNKEVYEIALKLRGLIKNKGSHASGYIVSYEPLLNICPLELTSDKKEIVSGYSMDEMASFALKLDLLGLRSASLVHEVSRMVGLDIEKINLRDPLIWNNLQNLETPHGLFQIEADTNYRVLRNVKPKNLGQLSDVLALARPGALQFVKPYSESLNENKKQNIHPFFDDVLEKTQYYCLYQEQLMRLINKVGFSLSDAETVRKIVGKKQTQKAKQWKKKIEKKVKDNNLDPKISDLLWKILEDSASYSFNLSHSLSYATLSAITTYLKFKYPKEFYLSLLKLTKYESDSTTEVSKIYPELRWFDIELLGPDRIKSKMDFSIEENDIRYGLLNIKGISDKTREKLEQFKDPFKNKFEIYQGANDAGLSIGILCALIQAGALDGLKIPRAETVLEAQLWNTLTDREKTYALALGEKNNYDLIAIINEMKTIQTHKRGASLNEIKNYDPSTEKKPKKKNPILSEKRLETIRKKYKPFKKIYNLNNKMSKFAAWWYENFLLGYSYSFDLIDIFRPGCKNLIKIEEVNALRDNSKVWFVSEVEDFRINISKNKNKYLKILAKDDTSCINIMLFKDKLDKFKENNDKELEKKDIIICHGMKKGDVVFGEFVRVQTHKIYTRLSQIK